MDGFQLTVIAKAFNDQQWRDDDARHGPQRLTFEEFDALAEFAWPGAGAVRRLTTYANAMRARAHPRARSRVEPAMAPSVEATAQA
jgi:hypothetical protein